MTLRWFQPLCEHGRGALRWLTLTFFACLLIGLAPTPAHAVNDPSLDWFTIETPHFIIHYHSGLEDLALRTADLCEEAHTLLAPLLDWTPGARTHVVLVDQIDTANGSAAAVPFNRMRLLGFAPTPRSTLNDYDDWLRGLVYHEYVHILHIDTVSSFSMWVNRLFGKNFTPNGALPKWYIEGIAVYFESQHTSGGRVRSGTFNMFMRTAALQDAFFPLSRLNGATVDWPRGRNIYLYGSFFISYLVATYGEDAIAQLNHRYGAQLLPYGINVIARQVFGVDFPTLYARWQTAFTAQSIAQWVHQRAQGPMTPHRQLTELGFESNHLRRRPTTRQLSFFRNNGYELPMIVTVDQDTGEQHELFEHFGDGRHDWSSDGTWLVCAEIEPEINVYAFNDLIRYDLHTGTKTRLTHRLRAREPALSPDNRQVVFVAARAGTTDLMRLDLETGVEEVLHRGQGIEQFSTPDYHPNGRQILVSRFVETPQPARDLYLFDLETRTWRQLTDDRALDLEPTFNDDGSLITWSTDRDGIFSIYSMQLSTGEVKRLTRTITGHFSPQLVDEGHTLAFSLYGAQGFDVAVTALPLSPMDAWALLPDAPQSFVRENYVYPEPEHTSVLRDYRPWRYLWPRTILPEFSDLLNANVFRLLLGGSDPVGLHSYLTTLTYRFEDDEFDVGINYVYGGLPFNIQLRGLRTVGRGGLQAESRDQNYREERFIAALDLSWAIPYKDESHVIFGTYSVERVALADPLRFDHRPDDIAPIYPELGFFNNLTLGWGYSTFDGYAFSISAERGFDVSAFFRLRAPWLGADYESSEVGFSSRVFMTNPLIQNHVLGLRFAGGIGTANYNRRGLFVIGGIPEQDFLLALINQLPIGGASLRGYEPAATFGDKYQLLNAEYRFPLFDLEKGAYTFPFYLGRISAALFVDHGGAYFGPFDFENFRTGVGAELRMGSQLGYFIPIAFRLGYARGLDEGGIDHLYFIVGNPF